jgi:hypothetical protein
MKQLFKTTLLAATIAVTCGSAVAGTVSVSKQTHSMEGLTGVKTTVTSNVISYAIAAAYAVGDKITFTFPTGALVATTFPSQLNVAAVNSATPTLAIAGMALGLLNSDADSVTYRVTSLSQPTGDAATAGGAYTDRTTIGATLPLGTVGVGYTPASVLLGAVTVTVSSQTSVGDNLDSTGTRTATVAEAKSQFGTAVANTMFDGVIDVAASRKLFVTPPSTTTDSMMWTITNPVTTGWMNMATINPTAGTVVTLYGEAGMMTDLTDTVWSNKGTRVFDATAASLTTSYNGQVTNDTVTFTAPGTVVLETQEFTTDLVYNYSSAAAVAGSKTIVTGLASGEWELNGATVNIPYMPYGATASQIIYVSNAGSQDGEILVTTFGDDGIMRDLGVVEVAAGKTVTKIGPEIRDLLLADGFAGTKASITITVNAPSADITVYASYNIGGADRGFVNTDQYKGDKD